MLRECYGRYASAVKVEYANAAVNGRDVDVPSKLAFAGTPAFSDPFEERVGGRCRRRS